MTAARQQFSSCKTIKSVSMRSLLLIHSNLCRSAALVQQDKLSWARKPGICEENHSPVMYVDHASSACSKLSFVRSWPATQSSRPGPQTPTAVMCCTLLAPPTTWWHLNAGTSVPGTAMCTMVQQKMFTWPLSGTGSRSGYKVRCLVGISDASVGRSRHCLEQ